MCKLIGKSNERILCKLSKSEILRLYSIVHVAMETTKTSNFTCQSQSSISIFFTCQVSACEQQPFSCHDLENDIYSQTAKTAFSHLYVDSDWKKQYLLTLRGEDSSQILSSSYGNRNGRDGNGYKSTLLLPLTVRNDPWEVPLIITYTGRLRPKGVPFSGFRYMKG